ncbi:MAG: thioredoxin family protein [Anaerolineales bacterium]|nr:thioredoxin family protein [Chloroflexota bacterium]MBL6979546.1 thioredoxin family protein [Anaerolineales bacterium]
MATEILTRTLLALAITGVGVGAYGLANRYVLRRAAHKTRGLETFHPGAPAILYFTTPACAPCKTIQRPAIIEVQKTLEYDVQVIEVNASSQTDMADYWGVLSVPTTFIIDKTGQPRHINHGVTSARELIKQIEMYKN